LPLVLALVLGPAQAVDDGASTASRQEEVARQGARVMPFSLAATRHVFTKTVDGGVQQVVCRAHGDSAQRARIRMHLQQMQARFALRDFAMPEQIHGPDMPGLAVLRQAAPQQLQLAYREIEDGAQLRYVTDDAQVRRALHAWFDAQAADHGADAMAGHEAMHAGAMRVEESR
jgi:hypothetical protein